MEQSNPELDSQTSSQIPSEADRSIKQNVLTSPVRSAQSSELQASFFQKHKKLLMFIIIVIVFLLVGFGLYVGLIKNSQKPLPVSPETTPVPTTISSFSQEEGMQDLERNPTEKVLTKELFMRLSGETKGQNGIYTGMIEKGRVRELGEEDRSEQEKRMEEIKADPKASNSLFLIEARDIDEQVLLERPIAVSHGTIGGDIQNYSYQDPGFFSVEVLLPINTNSLLLRKRSGDILDRVYFEEWQPKVEILDYPKEIGSTDKFQIEMELQPFGKTYSYSLFLG